MFRRSNPTHARKIFSKTIFRIPSIRKVNDCRWDKSSSGRPSVRSLPTGCHSFPAGMLTPEISRDNNFGGLWACLIVSHISDVKEVWRRITKCFRFEQVDKRTTGKWEDWYMEMRVIEGELNKWIKACCIWGVNESQRWSQWKSHKTKVRILLSRRSALATSSVKTEGW